MGDGGGLRTDFLRKTTDRAKSMFSNKSSRNSMQTAPHWKMPTPPADATFQGAAAGYPVTPERRLPHESDSESIKVYSPPSAAVQQPYPAHIAPLRGMATQRHPYVNNNNMGSPFQTPPSHNASTDKKQNERYAAQRERGQCLLRRL